ncbi:MAG: hypothetical protein M3Q27_03165 [Actinomycetota bacterium]|nr:hypothetical protein [Actinomycetota bacterium]
MAPPPPGCRALAGLFDQHGDVHEGHHPMATTAFSRSPYGPHIEQVVIEYGEERAASAAVADVREAPRTCPRLTLPRAGATSYDVAARRIAPLGDEAAALTLHARGADFATVGTDIAAVRAGTVVTVVRFSTVTRSAGERGHLGRAARAAVARIASGD